MYQRGVLPNKGVAACAGPTRAPWRASGDAGWRLAVPPDQTTLEAPKLRRGHDFSRVPVHAVSHDPTSPAARHPRRAAPIQQPSTFKPPADRSERQVGCIADHMVFRTPRGNATSGPMARGRVEALQEAPTPITRETQSLIDAQTCDGTPLEGSLREDMELLPGVRLDEVRLHGGRPEIDTLAQRLDANAFTQGHHVFLLSDRSPNTDAGRETLAHELTHVARGAPSVGAVMRQPQTKLPKQPQPQTKPPRQPEHRDPPTFAAKHHYYIELKAWIPHAQVVDPVPGVTDSHYRGDNHRGYEGSWRILNWVAFDWDGKKISGFHGNDNYGTSHRDWKRWGLSGTESATQTCCTGRDLNTEGYFTMWISSKNPIPVVPAPEVNSTLEVFVGCDSISFVYTTDEFPSHGIRVVQDGKIVETKIVFDASGVDGTDPSEIFLGLTEFENKGEFDVAVPQDLEACQSHVKPPTTVPP